MLVNHSPVGGRLIQLNTGPGDGIVFRLAHHLQHRNTSMRGAVPKTAFAGWFRSREINYHSWMKRELGGHVDVS